MTVNEAIDVLNRFHCLHVDSVREQAINMAIKALEKQVPMKPIRKPNHNWKDTEITCPTCGGLLFSEYTDGHCECGQKIDWE